MCSTEPKNHNICSAEKRKVLITLYNSKKRGVRRYLVMRVKTQQNAIDALALKSTDCLDALKAARRSLKVHISI